MSLLCKPPKNQKNLRFSKVLNGYRNAILRKYGLNEWCWNIRRDRSKTPPICKMDLFEMMLNDWKSLTIVTKSSNVDLLGFLGGLLINWLFLKNYIVSCVRCITNMYFKMYVIYLQYNALLNFLISLESPRIS